MSHVVSVRLDHDLHQEVLKRAEADGVTPAEYVRSAVELKVQTLVVRPITSGLPARRAHPAGKTIHGSSCTCYDCDPPGVKK